MARPIFHRRPERRSFLDARRSRVHHPHMRPRRHHGVSSALEMPDARSTRPTLRLQMVGAIVIVLFAVMVLRLWDLQVIGRKNYAAAAISEDVRTVTTPAPRGAIVDQNDTILANDAVQEDIVLSATERANLETPSPKLPLTMSQRTAIGTIAALVGLTPAQVQKAIDNPQIGPYQQVTLLQNASPATVSFLQAHPSSYPGLSVQATTQRTYPQGGTTAAQVLGYTQTSPSPGKQFLQVGVNGLEAQYNSALTGTPGKERLQVTPSGQVVKTTVISQPTQGNTLVTHLNLGLQNTAQAALDNVVSLDHHTYDPVAHVYPNPKTAAAVVLDARTGAVLAMASYPSENLSQWVGGVSNANFAALQASGGENNYAIDGLYTPGSDFKLVTSTAALETGLITGNYTYNDTGTYTVPGCTGTGTVCTLKDDGAALGPIQVATAITASDDVFFYNLGAMFWEQRATYGNDAIQHYGAQYGLDGTTGIDLPYEQPSRIDSYAERALLHKAAPKVFPPATWTTGDNMELAFGQGETVLTLIGVADAYATFANGGTRYQPQVAAAIVSPTGALVRRMEPKVEGHVSLPPGTRGPMLQGFEGTIANPLGTAYGTFQQYAKFPMSTYVVAGKTGTASTNIKGEPNAWFASFGPQPNPKYVVAAVVQHSGYGDADAAPATAQIWNYLYTNPVSGSVTLPTAAHPATTAAPPTNPPAGSTPSATGAGL